MILNKTFYTGLICISMYLNSLHAATLSTEFYPTKGKQGEMPVYGLTAIKFEGWPPCEYIEVFETRLSEPTKMRKPIKLKKGQNPIVDVSSPGYYPGEQVGWTFVDTSNNIEERVSFIPLPIYAKSTKDCARVEAKLLQFSPSTYAIELSGFNKDEEIIFECSSYHVHSSSTQCINETTNLHYTPAVEEKLGGTAKVKIKRSSGETIQLELPWGWESLKYTCYTDEKGQIKRAIDSQEFLKKYPEISEYFKTSR